MANGGNVQVVEDVAEPVLSFFYCNDNISSHGLLEIGEETVNVTIAKRIQRIYGGVFGSYSD